MKEFEFNFEGTIIVKMTGNKTEEMIEERLINLLENKNITVNNLCSSGIIDKELELNIEINGYLEIEEDDEEKAKDLIFELFDDLGIKYENILESEIQIIYN